MGNKDELPEGWTVTTLADLGELICGQSLPASRVNKRGEGIAYVTGPEHWDGQKIHLDKWTTTPARLAPEGCIFITVKGAGVGKLFPGVACAIGRDIYAYKADAEISQKFIELALRYTIEHVVAEAKGDIPGLTKKHILDHEIPLPPRDEQKRIVAKIEELFTELDSGKESFEAARRQLGTYRKTILKQAFDGQLTALWRSENARNLQPTKTLIEGILPPEQPRGGRDASQETIEGVAGLSVNKSTRPLPHGWEWTPLLRVARQETGHTPSRNHPEYWNGEFDWLSIPDARDHHGREIHRTVKTITQTGIENSAARLLPEQTVCLSRTASVGYVCILGKPMTTSQDFATWSCTEALLPRFLMYAIIAEGEDIKKFGKGTTHTTIYFPEIRALYIALPNPLEQREIISQLDAQLEAIRRNEKEIDDAIKQSALLRRSILKKAFTGQLVAQETDDEHATLLLHRIKDSKAAQESRTRRRERQPQTSEPVMTPTFISILTEQQTWISAQDLFEKVGITHGASTDDIEAAYSQLRQIMDQLECERRDEQDWFRLKGEPNAN